MAITPVSTLVERAKSEITSLSCEDVARRMGNESVLLVDIRDIRELERDGRIPGALHAPRGMLEFWIDPESPYYRDAFATEKTIVLFCASSWRSALAAKTLQDMGVGRVAEMEGGFKAWQAEGRPTS